MKQIDSQEKLVEEMAMAAVRRRHTLFTFSVSDEQVLRHHADEIETEKDNAHIMLSVVKANVHLAAKVCPECNGDGEFPKLLNGDGGFGGGVVSNTCKTCKGFGVMAI